MYHLLSTRNTENITTNLCKMNAKVFALFLVAIACIFVHQASAASSPQIFCLKPMETGECRGMFPKFGYNPLTNDCEEFIYGGCSGNENRFDTIEECRSVCIFEK